MWRKARRVARILAWIALSAILLALVAAATLILWARSPSGRRIILSTAVSTMRKQLAGRLMIDSLEGDLTRTITLRGIRLYDRERKLAVAADVVGIEYDVVALLSRQIRIRSLTVDGARVDARRLADGQLNVFELTKRPVTEPQPPYKTTPSNRRRSWDLVVEGARADAEVAVDARSGAPPLRGRVDLAGGFQWRASTPAFHDLRVRFVTDQLAAPLRATLSVDGPHDDIESELLVEAGRGEIRARANASVSPRGTLAWRATVQSRNVDPGALLVGAPHGTVEVAAHARGVGRTGAITIDGLTFDVAGTHASAKGTIELAAMLTADVRADAYSPDLSRLTGFGLPDLHGSIAAHAHLRRTSSHTDLDASATARELRIDRMRLARLSLRMHADEAHVGLRFNAAGPHHLRADVRAHGVPLLQDGRWGVDVAVDTFTVGTHGDAWRLSAPARVRIDRRAAFIALALAARDQTLVLDGNIDRDSGRLDFHLHGDRLDASRVARLVELDAPPTVIGVDAQLRGTRASPELNLTVDGRMLRWPRHDLPTVAFRLDAVADGRRVRSAFDAAAPGQSMRAIVDAPLATRDDAPLFADVRAGGVELEPLRALLPASLQSLSGQVDFDAHLTGTTHAPAVVAHLAVPHWTLGSLSASRFFADARYRAGKLEARWHAHFGEHDRAGVLLGDLALPVDLRRGKDALLSRTAPLSLRIRGQSLDLAQLPTQTFGAPADLGGGVVDLTLDVRGTVQSSEAQLRVKAHALRLASVDGVDVTIDGGYARRQATATATAAIHGEHVLSAQGESHFDMERLIERGRWQDLPLTAEVTIPSFALARVGRVGGIVRGAAQVHGTLAHPFANAELHARDLRLSDLRLTTLDLGARWDGGALMASVDAAEAAGGRLHLDGSLPAAANAPLHATLTADAFTFAIDDVGDVRRLDGILDAQLQISGTRLQPALRGFLRIDHGAFAGGSDPRLFRDLAVDVVAHDHDLELRRLSMRVARGEVTAHGSVALDGVTPKAFDLFAQAERFPFDATNAEAWINGAIELHGHTVGDRVEGTLTVSQGRMQLPNLERQRQLQSTGALEDVVYVDVPTPPRPDASKPVRHHPPLALQVVAHIPGPFRIDSPEMHAELRGELELRTVDGELGVYGHAEATAGELELLGRTYEIERARASFDGNLDPVLDVRVTRAMSDTIVIISVQGTAKSPRVELTSDPPVYNSSQVLGLILSGDPDSPRVDSSSIDRQLAGAISELLVSKLKAQLLPSLPIDVIKVQANAGDDTFAPTGGRLELGKYIRHNIFVSYSHQFGATMNDLHHSNAHEAVFEYRVRRHAILGVRYGDAGIGAVDFAWTLRY